MIRVAVSDGPCSFRLGLLAAVFVLAVSSAPPAVAGPAPAGTGTISGHATGTDGANVWGCNVQAVPTWLSADRLHQTQTDLMGNYTIRGLTPGSYKVEFSACGSVAEPFVEQWYNNRLDYFAADAVTVARGQHVQGIDPHILRGDHPDLFIVGDGPVDHRPGKDLRWNTFVCCRADGFFVRLISLSPKLRLLRKGSKPNWTRVHGMPQWSTGPVHKRTTTFFTTHLARSARIGSKVCVKTEWRGANRVADPGVSLENSPAKISGVATDCFTVTRKDFTYHP